MADKISAGKFPAKILDWGIRAPKSEGKDPTIQIVFEFADGDGQAHEYSWYGSLHPNAKEITLKTLLICGLKNNLASFDELVNFNAGSDGGALDTNKQLFVKIKMKQKYGAPDGEMVPEIAWVNDTEGAGGVQEKMANEDLVKVMGGYNLGGTVADLRTKTPVKEPKAIPNHAPGAGGPPTMDTNQNIPF